MKNRILFVLKFSKRNKTGFYLMNSYVMELQLLNSNNNTQFIKLYTANVSNRFLFRLQSIINLFSYSVQLVYKLIFFKPQLVYFTVSPVNSFLRDLVYIFIVKTFKVKLVYHLHGKGIKEKYRQNKYYMILYKWAYKNAYVICLSKKLRFDFDFLPINKYYVIPNAIRYFEVNKKEKSKSNTINILFLSNLIYSKGIVDYIEAVKIILKEHQDIKAWIVGMENELKENDLDALVSPFGQHINYLGPKYDKEKIDILSDTDIFVFPTTKDVWGLVVLEAMQAGIPVVATDEGAVTDMVEDGVNGFVVEKENPRQIAEKLKVLIQDKDLRIQMGKSSRDFFLNHFTIGVFEKRLNRVLTEILAI